MGRLVYVPDRIIDQNGIADGATVYVYASGTTTPISIYSDSGMTILMSNPFTVAAGAAFPPVYYDTATTIKLRIISNSTGAIDEYDPYDPVNASTGNSSVVSVKDFGAVADGVTDDFPAFSAAIAHLKSIAINEVIGEFKASPKLFIPCGNYYCSDTLDITHNLIIEGEGGIGIGAGGGAATKIRFAANKTGIRIQSEHTSGASIYDATGHYSGAFTTLRQLYLLGGVGGGGSLIGAGLVEGEYHGIHVKATVFLDSVTVEGFQGDALYANTTAGAHDATEGYSNASRAYNCTFRNSRNGVFLKGGDANVWTFVGCQALYNRACGLDDQSFLGNTHTGWHTNGNGVTGDNTGAVSYPAYVVSNGGNRYCPVQGQEATASTTAPSGTADTSVWLYIGAGGTQSGVPAWTTGMSLRCGAPYRTNNNNGRNVFINPYEEGGQGLSQFVYPTIVIGGLHGPGDPRGTHSYIRNTQGALTIDNPYGKGNYVFEVSSGEYRIDGSINSVDVLLTYKTGNNSFSINYKKSDNTTFGSFQANKNSGLIWDTSVAGGAHFFNISGSTVADVEAAGINMASGKVLKANGTQVVGARQTGTAANATDLASAITLVNDLKAKLITHGLIS